MASFGRLFFWFSAVCLITLPAAAHKEPGDGNNILDRLFHGLWEDPVPTATFLPTETELNIHSLDIKPFTTAGEHIIVVTTSPAREGTKVLARAVENPSIAADANSVPATAPLQVATPGSSTAKGATPVSGFIRPDPEPFLAPDAVPSKAVGLPAINASLASEDHYATDFGECKDAPNNKWQVICSEPYRFALPDGALGRKASKSVIDFIHRSNEEREIKLSVTGYYNYRTEIGPGTTEIIKGYPETTVNWCNTPGNLANAKDSCELCNTMNNNYVVPKAFIRSKDSQHMCMCKQWRKGHDVFQVCNCDVCDALIIPTGLRQQCRNMQNDCGPKGKGYLSAYTAFDNRNAFFRLYNDKGGVGYAHDFLVGEVQADLSVCKSGVQGKWQETYHGHLWDDEPHDLYCP
jgi:hypothetical protein